MSRASFQEIAPTERARRMLSNAMVLLWGPPGTGKTSLCKALAQRLSIRLQRFYSKAKLVELPATGMHSRYFGESAKLVWSSFSHLASVIRDEKDTLVCILIDEVESLCPSREQSIGSQEPRDGQRAVNALLTAVDQLRQYPNFLVFCTSNIIDSMDEAFIDRIDFKLNVPMPNAVTCAEILRRGYFDIPMGYLGPAAGMPLQSAHAEAMTTEDGQTITFEEFLCRKFPGPYFRGNGEQANSFACLKAVVEEQLLHPDMALLRFGPVSDHPAVRLWRIAQRCTQLSARTIERLPMLSLVQRSVNDQWPCPLDEAISALGRVVEQEVAVVRKRSGAVGIQSTMDASTYLEQSVEVVDKERAAEAA